MTDKVVFDRQLFGYKRTQVNRRLQQMKQELSEAMQQIENLSAKVLKAEEERDLLTATVYAMRRQQFNAVTPSNSEESIIILIGPSDSLAPIMNLIDHLERAPNLKIAFRVFRDGFYRIDSRCSNMREFIAWLKLQDHIRHVEVDGETIHVIPA